MSDTTSFMLDGPPSPVYPERPEIRGIRQHERKIDLGNSLMHFIKDMPFICILGDISKENPNDKFTCEITPEDNSLHIKISTKNNYIQLPKYFLGNEPNTSDMQIFLKKHKNIYSKFSLESNDNNVITYRIYFAQNQLSSPTPAHQGRIIKKTMLYTPSQNSR